MSNPGVSGYPTGALLTATIAAIQSVNPEISDEHALSAAATALEIGVSVGRNWADREQMSQMFTVRERVGSWAQRRAWEVFVATLKSLPKDPPD